MFEVKTGLRVEIRPRVKCKLDKVMPFCSLGGTKGGRQIETGARVRHQICRPVTRMAGPTPSSTNTCAALGQAYC